MVKCDSLEEIVEYECLRFRFYSDGLSVVQYSSQHDSHVSLIRLYKFDRNPHTTYHARSLTFYAASQCETTN